MATLEQLAEHVASLNDLQVVVRTMKALSAASIRQYEQAVLALTDYYRTVELGLNVVLRDRKMPPEPRPRPERPAVAIVFGSDHGLCGRFNEDVADYVVEHLQASPHTQHLVLAVGARVAARLDYSGIAVAHELRVPGSAVRITATVMQILLDIDAWRSEQGAERVTVYYNRHVSSARYRPTSTQMLPVDLTHFQRLEQQPWPSHILPTYSMHAEPLFSALLREYFFVTLFRACAESEASEQGSRLGAMRAAEKNLDERVDEVSMAYRQARQGEITSELLDVVAGFEALSDADHARG